MILFPLLLPSGLLRRGLGGGGRHKCGKTWSQGSWLRPPLSFPSAFGHLGEEAAREEVQAGGGAAPRGRYATGRAQGNEGNMAWLS